MGYSVAIRTKSRPLQKQMKSFMEEHYRVWRAVIGAEDPTIAYSSLKPTDALFPIISSWIEKSAPKNPEPRPDGSVVKGFHLEVLPNRIDTISIEPAWIIYGK